jgi:Abnormal spindle-like microcephaly-assoc'd, ASPM-SPD-2-Hydin
MLAAMAIVMLAFAARPIAAQMTTDDAAMQKPALKVNPKKINFGTLNAGTRKTRNITIKNASKTMTLNVSVFLPSVPPFVVIHGGGSFALPPKGKQIVTVQFAPAFGGTYTNFNVEIGSNDPLNPSVTVPLSGKAKSKNLKLPAEPSA